MKVFYLLRHEDVSKNSGTGVVAEGIIFDNNMVAMTWLSKYPTITVFPNISTVEKLHSHEGKTEVIIQGSRKSIQKFEDCKQKVRIMKSIQNKKRVQ